MNDEYEDHWSEMERQARIDADKDAEIDRLRAELARAVQVANEASARIWDLNQACEEFDARIEELQEERDAARTLINETGAGTWMRRAEKAEARLAAVIALCDKEPWPDPFKAKVRAAATGDTK